jgi:ribonucleoside-diphosphate reductase alpha chain
MFLEDTACNLASLNLLKFICADGRFDVEGFSHAIRVLICAQEFLVDFASYPTAEIAERSHRYRPLGLGYANLGAALMALGLPYESEEARDWAAAVTALMTGEAYAVSAELAQVFGAFEGYAGNEHSMQDVISKHRAAFLKLETQHESKTAIIVAAARDAWERAQEQGARFGYRNAQVTVLAPTGTIAFMMDCDTTGIEPDFALVKDKALAGGGRLRLVNRSVERALLALGYPIEASERIATGLVSGSATHEGQSLLRHLGVREEHLGVFACADEISPQGHLLMMAAVQPFLSGAISKTVNLAHDATVEDIESIFKEGWKLGLKAVAVYRDGSKSAQPLRAVSRLSEERKATRPYGVEPRGVELCPVCSHPTVVSGTCWVCPQCGHSIACS